MKNKYLLSLFAILIMQLFWGQTTETFETETTSSTTFTDNSQVFTITSQAQGPFDINTDYPGTGWNGSTADNIFLDNDLEADLGVGVEFTISSGGSSFTLKSIYLYLADNSANVNVSGGLTIVGKLGGTAQFTVSQSSSFNNTNLGVNNGFTLIDFTSFGGTNNSNTNIDKFVITTTGSFNYVALDAMKWDVAASTAPTVTSVTVPANATYIAGQNLDFTINTDENVTVNTLGGTPQLAITIGATTRQATYQNGSGTSALLFRYTVQTGELDTDGIAVGTLIANGGTLRNASSNDANLTLNNIGSTSAVLIDAVAPSIPSPPNMGGVSDSGSSNTDDITTDTTPNFLGSKGVGSDIIKLTSSVDGLLGTALSNGSTNWLFNSSPVLSEGVHNITATATNGAGNESAASASLTITIDNTAPTVGSSNPTDNATGVDGSGNIIITFNENVVFGTGNIEVIDATDGSNSFTINTASPGSQAAISGALLTISPSSDLDEFSNYSVRIDATAIDDVAGNSFAGINNGTTLNFTTTGNTAPVVDTNSGLTVTEGATAIIDSGKLHASDTETSDDSQKTFTVTTATTKGTLFFDANQNNIYDTGDTVLGLSATFTMDNINNDRIRYTSTTDIDIADSFVFTLSDPDGGSLTNQAFSITISPVNDEPSIAINNGITLNQGNNIVITNANLNEGDPDDSGLGVTYTITSDVINGQLFLDANSNSTFDGGENQMDINESFTQADIDNGLVVYQHNGSQTTSDNFEFSLADGGDNGTTALMGQTFNITVNDVTPPTVISVTVPANTTYIAGQYLDFTINTNENVTINTTGGSPVMAMTIGATTRQAIYQSGSGTSALLFRYTVQTGDSDTDGIAIGTLSTNGTTMRDGAANELNTTLNNVGSTIAVLVDAAAPTVTSVTVPANATYIAGENLDFTINTSENVTINTTGGSPVMAMTIGATTRQAIYQSGSGTSALLFRYTVQTGDSDTDGIAIGTLSTNGTTIRDGVANELNTTLNNVGSTIAVLVDAAAPTVTSVTVPANATYIAGENLDFTINMSENVTVNTAGGTPQIAMTIGAATRQAIYQSGSGTSALLFRYTVQTGELDTDGIAIGTLSANGGTLMDGAINNLNNTLNNVGSTTVVLVDAVAPAGYTVSFDQNPINGTNEASMGFSYTGAEIGSTYNYIISSSGGGTNLTGTGTIITTNGQVGEIDLSTLADGTITLDFTLTDIYNNLGNIVSDAVIKGNDTDNDGIPDSSDNCPSMANSNQLDTDTDGEGDACDMDDDNDGTLDSQDDFPLDNSENTDTDGDGTGNNADTDDDNDGTLDSEDAFPLDNSEDTDTDGDGTGNNTDTNDDNDGTLDSDDPFPLDNSEDTDTDSDGTGNNADTDDDNDGTPDSEDAFPLDPTEDKDSDNDGIGDNADTDDDLVISVNIPVPAEAFTPNGDGINDAWLVPGINNYPNNVVKVFNRYGHEVYAKRNYQNDWTGRQKSGSSILPAGSYLYVIDLGNGTAPLQGWIFINY